MTYYHKERPKRWHYNLITAWSEAFYWIFEKYSAVDKVVQHILKQHKKWGSKDRRLFVQVLYDLLRYWNLWTAIAGLEKPRSKKDFFSITLIALKAYYPDVPFPSTLPLFAISEKGIRKRYETLIQQPEYRFGLPSWLLERFQNSYPDTWEALLQALNRMAPVYLRVNTLKASAEEVVCALQQEGIEAKQVEGFEDAVVLLRRANIFKLKIFQKGYFEVQDLASQQVAPLLEVKPGMRVVDACAGAGGKTLHLAALMHNKGEIIALDVDAHRLQQLRLRARRAGAHNIRIRPIHHNKVVKRLYGSADRLLLDVPCSGTGTLKRNPDIKWHLTPQKLGEYQQKQREILQNYAPILKRGGIMLYVTCSLLPEENQQQIQWFLTHFPNFRLQKELLLLPTERDWDGFYIAQLQKT